MSNILRVRTPYFLTIDESVSQTESKIELFIWYKGDTEPTLPTYTISKKAPSTTNRENVYNISPFVKQFFDIVYPTEYVTVPVEENYYNWANVKVKTYYKTTADFILHSTLEFVAVNGYNEYNLGVNSSSLLAFMPLIDTSIKVYITQDGYINAWLDAGDYVWNNDNDAYTFTVSEDALYCLPITDGANYLEFDSTTRFTVNAELLCEPKYTPVVCNFINRLGGWGTLTFFKAQTNSLEVKSKEYTLLPQSIDYDIHRGQSQAFNFEAKQSVKLSTGWVDENYSNVMQDLLTSETILLDNKPVKLKTTSTPLKSILQDKMINYDVEFEYNYNLINNVQ